MTTATNKKSLDLLLQRFHDVSENTKELDTVVSNFSDVIEHFSETLIDLDERFPVQEIGELSSETIKKMKEIKSYNELQMLELLREAVKEEVTEHTKGMQENFEKNITKQAMSNRKVETLLKQVQSKLDDIEKNKGETGNPRYEEMMVLLQRIEQQTRIQFPTGTGANEEVEKLKKMVYGLSGKMRKMEENYESRILILENEIDVLRSQLSQTHVDIDDEEFSF